MLDMSLADTFSSMKIEDIEDNLDLRFDHTEGGTRKVYLDKERGVVYKIPIMPSDSEYSILEYRQYLAFKATGKDLDGVVVYMAEVEMIYSSNGYPIIVMELLSDIIWSFDYIPDLKQKASWLVPADINQHFDRVQLGYSQQQGLYVLFDHNYNPKRWKAEYYAEISELPDCL